MAELLKALRRGEKELVAALEADSSSIDAAAESETIGSGSAILHAANEGKFKAMEVLLSYGADVRSASSTGVNVVDCLSSRPEAQAVKLLEAVLAKWISFEDLGEMLNSPRLGRTPLMSAVFAPNLHSSELLLSFRANASYALEDGSCALDLAAQCGGRRGHDLVRLLLDAAADPNVGAIGPLFLAVQVQNLSESMTHSQAYLLLYIATPLQNPGFHKQQYDSKFRGGTMYIYIYISYPPRNTHA